MTPEQRSKIEQAKRLCTEIGLQTYGRRPHEMQQTTVEWKLAKVEGLVREIRATLP